MIDMQKKEFRMMQTSAAPGIYASLLVAPYFILVNFHNFILPFLLWIAFLVSLYFDYPLRYLLRRYYAVAFLFHLSFIFVSVFPVLFVLFGGPGGYFNMLDCLVIIGAVFMFFFLAVFYSEKRLERHGWKCLSVKAN